MGPVSSESTRDHTLSKMKRQDIDPVHQQGNITIGKLALHRHLNRLDTQSEILIRRQWGLEHILPPDQNGLKLTLAMLSKALLSPCVPNAKLKTAFQRSVLNIHRLMLSLRASTPYVADKSMEKIPRSLSPSILSDARRPSSRAKAGNMQAHPADAIRTGDHLSELV